MTDHHNQFQEKEHGVEGCALNLLAVILALIIMFFLGSCAPRTIVNERVVHDTAFVNKIQHDSVYQKDSIYVHEYLKGDTVCVDRDRWLTIYKEKLTHDSIYIHKTDTIVKTQEVKAEKKSGWKVMGDTISHMFVGAIIGILVLLYAMWYKGK